MIFLNDILVRWLAHIKTYLYYNNQAVPRWGCQITNNNNQLEGRLI